MRDYAGLLIKLHQDLGFSQPPDSHVYSDMTGQDVAKVSLASSFYKKLCPTGNTVRADAAALEKFESINASLPDAPWDFEAENEAESCFYDYYRDNLRVVLEPHESDGSFDLDFIRENMMTGPGAAQKADSTSMMSKLFDSPMSFTNPALIPIYRTALVGTGFWCDAEMARYQKYGFTKVRGGKLFFASKNAEISRTCCTEASLDVIIQKACGAFLEYRLGRHFGISLSDQPDNNRELARIGSIDGSFGTIDLVSASDSIGYQLFLRDMPAGVLKNTMLACCSRTAVLPDGREVDLRMISTMGNGFTFPLQTVIFACAVRAVYQLMGFPSVNPRTQFGVFGDDIIVRREAYDFVVAMLFKLGFKVNVGKSFNTGAFRESCGHDYYNGLNVRGVYVRSLEIPQQVYSLINRLQRWSATHNVALLSVLKELRSWVREIRVPPSEADDAGIHVPFKLSPNACVDNRYWFQYRSYARRVNYAPLPEPDAEPAPFNPEGLAVGFLSGHIRRRDFVLLTAEDTMWKHDVSLAFPLRERRGVRARYSIVHKSIPYWDYLRDSNSHVDTRYGDEWRCDLTVASYSRWEAGVVAMLSN